MNTPIHQAELYRKAAETIEMCAKHGIEPMVKVDNILNDLFDLNLQSPATLYKFPLEVIEGKLVWEGDELYSWGCKFIVSKSCDFCFSKWSWNPPKQLSLGVVIEGRQVYQGDKLWNIPNNFSFVANFVNQYGIWGEQEDEVFSNGARYEHASWTQPIIRKPLCEIEGKPVHIGDKGLHSKNNTMVHTYKVVGAKQFSDTPEIVYIYFENYGYVRADHLSWNPPKRTITVELLVEDAKRCANQGVYYASIAEACRKALQGQQK